MTIGNMQKDIFITLGDGRTSSQAVEVINNRKYDVIAVC